MSLGRAAAVNSRPCSHKRITQQRRCFASTKYNSLSIGNRSITLPMPSFKVAKVTYNGHVSVESLETPDLLKAAGIYSRDLFLLNVTSRQERQRKHPVQRGSAVIMPRTNLILVSLGNVRAVVGLKELWLLDAHQPVVLEFTQEMSEIFAEESHDYSISDPPELLFLDEVLRDTVDAFARRLSLYREFFFFVNSVVAWTKQSAWCPFSLFFAHCYTKKEPIVDSFLDKVSSEVYSDTGVHLLVPLKDSLQAFEIQVRQSVDCLASLLNNDETMLDLLLTEQAAAEQTGSEVDFERQ